MPFLDSIITNRERVVSTILGTDHESTLNSEGSSSKQISGSNSIARDMKDILNQIKSLAFSEYGKVDYQKIGQDPLYHSFRELTAELHSFDINGLTLTAEKLAFWINLYNALVIDAVIQENVKKSVTESRLGIMAFFQRAAYKINGHRYSLTDIEQGLLRYNRGFPYFPGPHFPSRDPRIKSVVEPFDLRIHFALNCASKSCPPINIYTPEKLEDQLNLAASNFINQDLAVNLEHKTITISKIYKWYELDFGGKPGIIELLGKYVKDHEIARWLEVNSSTIKIKFHPYDWGLNNIIQ